MYCVSYRTETDRQREGFLDETLESVHQAPPTGIEPTGKSTEEYKTIFYSVLYSSFCIVDSKRCIT